MRVIRRIEQSIEVNQFHAGKNDLLVDNDDEDEGDEDDLYEYTDKGVV